MPSITLNGEKFDCIATTLSQLLNEVNAPVRGIAIEQNGSIIPKSTHDSAAIAEGDAIEIVSFIGGG